MEHHFKTIYPNTHTEKENRADTENIGVSITIAAPGSKVETDPQFLTITKFYL